MDKFTINNDGTVTFVLAMTRGETKSGNPKMSLSSPRANAWPPHTEIADTATGHIYPLYGALALGLTAKATAAAVTRPDTDASGYVVIDGVAYPKATTAAPTAPKQRGRPAGSRNKATHAS